MGFVMDGLDSESYDRTYPDKVLVKRILGYFSTHRKKMTVISLCLAANSAAGSAGPIIISRAVDAASHNLSVGTALFLAFSVMLLGASGWLFNYIQQLLAAKVVGDVVLDIRSGVFRRTMDHDFSFFDQHESGKIVSRITSDTQDFSQIVTLVLDVISQFLLVAILTVWLSVVEFSLTLLLLAMTPVAIGIALSFRKLARKVTRDSKKVNAVINSQIQESISGIMVAKTFRQEGELYTSFTANNAKSYKIGIRRGIVMNLIFPLISLSAGIGTALVAWSGGLRILDGSITPGNWYLFMQAVGFFWWPMLNIASFWSQFQDGLSAAERVFSLIDQESQVTQTGSVKLEKIRGNITFINLGFSYTEKEKIFSGFSLDIKAGETVAIVGHTGAGKSSIARLIARFYEFQQGEILIDGTDIRSLDLPVYRQQIGIVPQDPYLFTGTVLENIRYGCPDSCENDAVWAARHLGKGDWIEDLPNGLDTDAGHRGSSISMGQRQLVALARMLLKNPAIFILDEATASVDPLTEAKIQEGLSAVMKERTAIVIAHRLSTVKSADRIIVLEKGKIIEQGTHDGLLARGGHYSELYNTYFRHQSLEYIEESAKQE
ncbi:MAG: ABC transporter ATP-binding protein [Spirochaetales bacterium]|nr:ABC transporter ATP-binding protein [Spirochaetales bacterium]